MRLRFRTEGNGRWSVRPAGEDGPPEQLLPEPPHDDSGPPSFPPTPLDGWWNRRFPPLSTARLVFLLCALPVVGAVHALVTHFRGGEVSLARSVFVAIMSGILLTFLWFSGALRPGGRPAKGVAGSDGASRARNPVREFLLALPFSFACVLVLQVVMSGWEVFDPAALLVSAVAAVAVALIVVLRHLVWSVVLFSVLVGLGGGVLLYLFTSLWGSGDSFLVSWLIASVVVFAWALPFWLGMRRRFAGRGPVPTVPGRRTAPPEPQMWVIMTGTLIMVVGAAIFFALTEGASPSVTRGVPRPPESSPVAPTGMPTRESAALELFEAWQFGDRARAERVAHADAVGALLATPFPMSARFRGCGTVAGGFVRCGVEASGRLLLMAPDYAGSGFVVRFVEWVPLDTPIEFRAV